MSKITPVRVGICGVRGYSGLEAARLIARHEGFRLVTASSDALAGKTLASLDPELGEDAEAVVVGHNDTVAAAKAYKCELMLLALPAEPSGRVAPALLDAGIRVIDLSGAHRLKDPIAHTMAYGFEPIAPALQEDAIYGLTEFCTPEQLREARIVANPGCYPTATLLPLLPLHRKGLIEPGTLVVDGKSGTTGAGKKAKVSLLHAEMFGNFYAYRVGQHQHTPEIAQELGRAGRPTELTFVTHLLPVARGILVTSYFKVTGENDVNTAAAKVHDTLNEHYRGSKFVRVVDSADDVQLGVVIGTNRCVMCVAADPFGKRVVVISVIDNLLKGAAGQALQNANLMFGFPEEMGLGLRGGTGVKP